MIAFSQGRYAEMVDQFEEMRRLAPLNGDIFDLIWSNRMSGLGLLHLENIPRACRRLQEGLELAQQHNDSNGVLAAFIHLAGLAAAVQDTQNATLLLGFVEHQYEDWYKPMDAHDRIEFDRYMAQVKTALDEPEFSALWQQGREMTMEAALDMARKI